MNLYYAEGDQQVGPVGKTELQELLRAKKLNAQTLVWQPGMENWQELGVFIRSKSGKANQISESAVPLKQAECAECGLRFAEDEMIRFQHSWVCAGCKPVFVQKIKEGVSVAGALNYAGFWIRVGAWFIDYIIMAIASAIIYVPLTFMGISSFDESGAFVIIQLISTILNFIIPAVYESWFVGKYAATPGKMACKLKVVMADSGRVSFGRAIGRHFAKYISGLIFCIGYFMAGFDDQKRTLHDRICDTRVIKAGEI